jgi:hypothetical protein
MYCKYYHSQCENINWVKGIIIIIIIIIINFLPPVIACIFGLYIM